MGARETWLQVMVKVTTENDGPVFMRRGSEAESETITVGKAVARFGTARVRRELEATLQMLRTLAGG